jgi:hypothetical protein
MSVLIEVPALPLWQVETGNCKHEAGMTHFPGVLIEENRVF